MHKGSLLIFIVGILLVVFMIGGYATEKMEIVVRGPKVDKVTNDSSNDKILESEQWEEIEDTYVIPEEVSVIVNETDTIENREQFESFLKEFHVPKEYVEEILALVEQGYSLRDIMITYDFLFENFGSMDEFTMLLSKQKKGEDLPQLFDAYLESKPEYILKDFPEGEIDRLLSYQYIDIEDILVADIMAQEAEVTFEEIMEPLTSGEDWQQVAVKVGSLKCDGRASKTAVSSEEIDAYAEENDVSRQKAARNLSIEKKTGKKQERSGFLGLKKTTNSPGHMMVAYLQEKYE